MARKKLAEIVLGGDPQEKRAAERRQGTLREVIDLYMRPERQHGARTRTHSRPAC